MCGLVLHYGQNHQEKTTISLDKLHHRGPNSRKLITTKLFSFGFAQLAINGDPKKRDQPYENDNYLLAVNGEIYNSNELAQQYSIPLSGSNDCDIIIPLYEKFGLNFISKLDGFYSGLIIHKDSLACYSFRDYIGKKSLFIGRDGKDTFITSELKSIVNFDCFQALPKGLAKINLITGNCNELEINTKPAPQSLDAHALNSLLSQAVLKRIPRHLPFGVFLSGGLDSSIITNIILKHGLNAKFYTLADGHDRQVVQENYGHLRELNFCQIPKCIEALVYKVIEITESYNPSIISNGIGSYLLAERAKADGLKVILMGEGADELFYGYQDIHMDSKRSEQLRCTLVNDMTSTELRRVDLTTMANSIEARLPFLDREVFNFAMTLSRDQCNYSSSGIIEKSILREAFKDILPAAIYHRKKVSLDLGSTIRKKVVDYLRGINKSERQAARIIFEKIYPNRKNGHPYYYEYRAFDELIDKRQRS